jgi:mono/diheme cytochrome c family protein
MYKVIAAAATAAACLAAGSATAQIPVERGKYLVESIMGCGNCHTPVGPNGPILDKALSGGPPIGEGNAFTAIPSNITPDPETGIGTWTDAEIKTAIRQGKRPPNAHKGGALIGPPMPFGQYRGIADADIDAIVAYLRTVPAVRNAVAKSTYNTPLPPAWGPPIDKPITAPPASGTVAYGAYLAGSPRPLRGMPHADRPGSPPAVRDAAGRGRHAVQRTVGAERRQEHHVRSRTGARQVDRRRARAGHPRRRRQGRPCAEAADGLRLLQQDFSRRHGRADRLVAQPAGEEDAIESDRRETVSADTKFTGVHVSRYAALTANFSSRQILSSIRSPSLRNLR